MPKLYQIHDEDLATLERDIPLLADAALFNCPPEMQNRIRVQMRRVKEILSNVRWDYGPAEEIEVIDMDDHGEGEEWKSNG